MGTARDRSALRRPRVDAGDDRSARPPTRGGICTAPLRRLVRPPPRRRGCHTGNPDLRRVPRPPPRTRRRDAGFVRPDRGRRVRPDLLHRRGTPHPGAPRPCLDRASDLRVPRERPSRHGQHRHARTSRDHPRFDDPGRRPRRQRRPERRTPGDAGDRTGPLGHRGDRTGDDRPTIARSTRPAVRQHRHDDALRPRQLRADPTRGGGRLARGRRSRRLPGPASCNDISTVCRPGVPTGPTPRS